MKLRRYVGRVVPPVLFVLLLPVAFAAPAVVSRDHADNALYFTYNADDDSIEMATSSVRHTRNDKVAFITRVDESETTLPLEGQITLRLSGDKAVVYDGTFTYTVTDAAGDVAFTASKEKSFVLRPRAGRRTMSIRFLFDVPSNDYAVKGKFQAAS